MSRKQSIRRSSIAPEKKELIKSILFFSEARSTKARNSIVNHYRADKEKFKEDFEKLDKNFRAGGMGLLDLIKNQKVSLAMTVWELHQYILKTEMDQIEEELKEFGKYDPYIVVQEIDEKIETISYKIALRKEHTEMLLKNLTNKFVNQWKDEDEYDPSRVKFKLLKPELRTRVYPYLPYKRHRPRILKAANLAYVDEYCTQITKSGKSLNILGPQSYNSGDPNSYLKSKLLTQKLKDKLKAKKKKQEILEKGLKSQSSKNLFSKILGRPRKKAERREAKIDTTIPSLMLLNDPLEKKFDDEEKEEYRQLKRQWKSSQACLEFLDAIRHRITDEWKHHMKDEQKRKKYLEQNPPPDRQEQFRLLTTPQKKRQSSESPEIEPLQITQGSELMTNSYIQAENPKQVTQISYNSLTLPTEEAKATTMPTKGDETQVTQQNDEEAIREVSSQQELDQHSSQFVASSVISQELNSASCKTDKEPTLTWTTRMQQQPKVQMLLPLKVQRAYDGYDDDGDEDIIDDENIVLSKDKTTSKEFDPFEGQLLTNEDEDDEKGSDTNFHSKPQIINIKSALKGNSTSIRTNQMQLKPHPNMLSLNQEVMPPPYKVGGTDKEQGGQQQVQIITPSYPTETDESEYLPPEYKSPFESKVLMTKTESRDLARQRHAENRRIELEAKASKMKFFSEWNQKRNNRNRPKSGLSKSSIRQNNFSMNSLPESSPSSHRGNNANFKQNFQASYGMAYGESQPANNRGSIRPTSQDSKRYSEILSSGMVPQPPKKGRPGTRGSSAFNRTTDTFKIRDSVKNANTDTLSENKSFLNYSQTSWMRGQTNGLGGGHAITEGNEPRNYHEAFSQIVQIQQEKSQQTRQETQKLIHELDTEMGKYELRFEKLQEVTEGLQLLSYVDGPVLQSLYQYRKGEKKMEKQEKEEIVARHMDIDRVLNPRTVKIMQDSLKFQLRDTMQRKQNLKYSKVYNH